MIVVEDELVVDAATCNASALESGGGCCYCDGRWLLELSKIR